MTLEETQKRFIDRINIKGIVEYDDDVFKRVLRSKWLLKINKSFDTNTIDTISDLEITTQKSDDLY